MFIPDKVMYLWIKHIWHLERLIYLWYKNRIGRNLNPTGDKSAMTRRDDSNPEDNRTINYIH